MPNHHIGSSDIIDHLISSFFLFLIPCWMWVGEIRHVIEVQKGWIDSESEEGGWRAIEENCSEMGGALCTFTSLVWRVSGSILSSNIIHIFKIDTLFHCSNAVVNMPPESSMSCVWLEFMIEGKKTSIANSAVIKASGEFSPKRASERSFEGFCLDEELLVWR